MKRNQKYKDFFPVNKSKQKYVCLMKALKRFARFFFHFTIQTLYKISFFAAFFIMYTQKRESVESKYQKSFRGFSSWQNNVIGYYFFPMLFWCGLFGSLSLRIQEKKSLIYFHVVKLGRIFQNDDKIWVNGIFWSKLKFYEENRWMEDPNLFMVKD